MGGKVGGGRGVVGPEGERRAVAFALGVWRLAATPDTDVSRVVPICARSDVLQCDARAGRRLLERLPESCATRGRCSAPALPADRPATHLVAEVVHRLAADHDLVHTCLR